MLVSDDKAADGFFAIWQWDLPTRNHLQDRRTSSLLYNMKSFVDQIPGKRRQLRVSAANIDRTGRRKDDRLTGPVFHPKGNSSIHRGEKPGLRRGCANLVDHCDGEKRRRHNGHNTRPCPVPAPGRWPRFRSRGVSVAFISVNSVGIAGYFLTHKPSIQARAQIRTDTINEIHERTAPRDFSTNALQERTPGIRSSTVHWSCGRFRAAPVVPCEFQKGENPY